MLAKSKSHFLFTARECVRLIKITHESSQGAKNTRPTFLYLLAYLVFTFPSKVRHTFILSRGPSKAYNFKGQKFFAKMWAKSSYYQIWTPQSTHYRVNATFSDEQRVFKTNRGQKTLSCLEAFLSSTLCCQNILSS